MLGEEIQYSLHVDSLYQFADWHFDDGTAMDTLLAKTQLTHTFQCDGWHLITAVAYDTGTVCSQTIAQVDKQILVLSPSIEIINVTSNEAGDALEINLKTKNTDFYQKNFFLYRRAAGTNNWILVQTFTSNETKIIDKDVDINTYTYEYKVETNADCPNSISTVVHQSILVQTEQNEHEGEIFWTDYVGWQSGVDQYEVWVSIDSAEYKLLEKTAQSQFHYADKNSGFDHCFRIIARERDGNEATSLSNSSCVSFVPEIKTYNVITPNSIDQINEYFTIDNIEHYKNSKLVIMNRHGKVMLETTGYNNDWNGQVNGRRLPSGTYFFELELNEPRNEIARIRGYFSILY
jgi:gliding motility-associated-like protein